MSGQLNLGRLQSLLRTEFIGRSVTYRQSVGSTMELAGQEAKSEAAEGFVAIAEEQSAGRGRLGRHWVSPPGQNLYVTLLVRPTLPQLRYLAVIAPLAVCHAIEETTGLLPRIKWPNDVLLEGKKVCGILLESKLTDDAVQHALIGIGINVNLDVAANEEIRDVATSLRAELGREVEREAVLSATLNHL